MENVGHVGQVCYDPKNNAALSRGQDRHQVIRFQVFRRGHRVAVDSSASTVCWISCSLQISAPPALGHLDCVDAKDLAVNANANIIR